MLTLEKLRSLVHYDPETGLLSRLNAPNKPIGWKDDKGYLRAVVDAKTYKVHRVVFFYMTGKWPINQVDHINTIKDDNRWINLREATNSQNKQNSRINKTNTTGAKGVTYRKDISKWLASIKLNQKRFHLGCYDTKEAAAQSYENAAKWYFGEFARTK